MLLNENFNLAAFPQSKSKRVNNQRLTNGKTSDLLHTYRRYTVLQRRKPFNNKFIRKERTWDNKCSTTMLPGGVVSWAEEDEKLVPKSRNTNLQTEQPMRQISSHTWIIIHRELRELQECLNN